MHLEENYLKMRDTNGIYFSLIKTLYVAFIVCVAKGRRKSRNRKSATDRRSEHHLKLRGISISSLHCSC